MAAIFASCMAAGPRDARDGRGFPNCRADLPHSEFVGLKSPNPPQRGQNVHHNSDVAAPAFQEKGGQRWGKQDGSEHVDEEHERKQQTHVGLELQVR